MNQLSLTVSTAFALTTLASLLLFLKATGWNRLAAIGLLAWCAVLALLARAGFFTVYDAMPPRFLLVVLPPLVATLTLFFTARGRRWMNGLDARTLTLLHTMRVPVELVLFWLAAHKAVPQLMTFEGRNFDILTGLTAPVIWYLVFVRRALGYRSLLAWNLVCSGLLLWIVAHAILSAPTPLQQLAFDQPNVAVFYFPFIWLPGVVVPLCYVSHAVVMRRIGREKREVEVSAVVA